MKIDRPFLEKFGANSAFYYKESDLKTSVIEEIARIISCRISDQQDGPFEFGIQDTCSLTSSETDVDKFGEHCRKAILRFEPRLQNITITNLRFDHRRQSMHAEIECQLRANTLQIFRAVITNHKINR